MSTSAKWGRSYFYHRNTSKLVSDISLEKIGPSPINLEDEGIDKDEDKQYEIEESGPTVDLSGEFTFFLDSQDGCKDGFSQG